MISRDRVINVIKGEKTDKIPIYGWLFDKKFSCKIIDRYGSIEAAEDRYEFDLKHVFASFAPYMGYEKISGLEPEDALDFTLTDANDLSLYKSVIDDIRAHKEKRGKFCYIQTPGCFEYFNGIFGIENHLMYLLLYPDQLKMLYSKLAGWTKTFLNNCIDLGMDMIHVSDDWGSQNSLMFSREVWDDLIYPYHKDISNEVKRRGAYLSLHSDGNIMSVLDGITDIGYDVVHPFQVSAGMDYDVFLKCYKDRFKILSGIDVQTTLGFGNYPNVEKEIRDVFDKFRDGGLILCTTHMIQSHCSIEEFEFAYDLVCQLNRGK